VDGKKLALYAPFLALLAFFLGTAAMSQWVAFFIGLQVATLAIIILCCVGLLALGRDILRRD
jgi:hypothetical protein